MSTVALGDPRARAVEVTDEVITAYLVDGRTISVPIVWLWRLSQSTPVQRAHYELIGEGEGIHWPDIDEDISVRSMLEGRGSRRPEEHS